MNPKLDKKGCNRKSKQSNIVWNKHYRRTKKSEKLTNNFKKIVQTSSPSRTRRFPSNPVLILNPSPDQFGIRRTTSRPSENFVRCSMFITFTRTTLQWFSGIFYGTITSFSIFSQKFVEQFVANKVKPPRIANLFNVKQQENELLNDCISCFWDITVCNHHPNQMFIDVFVKGLRANPLSESPMREQKQNSQIKIKEPIMNVDPKKHCDSCFHIFNTFI